MFGASINGNIYVARVDIGAIRRKPLDRPLSRLGNLRVKFPIDAPKL
jgi:hypothetical protein